MARPKITVVGAGNVGATCAHWAASRELADVVLVDVVAGMPQGKALDLAEAAPSSGSTARWLADNGYEATAGSEVVVITSGLPRKPGMSREDLLDANVGIVAAVTREGRPSPPTPC